MQISAKLYEMIRLHLNFGAGRAVVELDVQTSLFCVSLNCISQILKVYVSYIVICISLVLHLERGRAAARLDVKTSLFRVSSDWDPVQDPTFGLGLCDTPQ